MQAHHLLLHQALKPRVGVNAVEVVENRAKKTLPRRLRPIEHRQAGEPHSVGHRLQSRRVKSILALEVVVKKSLVDARLFGDLLGPRSRQPLRTELLDGGSKNACARLVRALRLASS